MKTLDDLNLTRPRKIALAALAAAWSLDLGYGIFVTQSLSLIKVTLLLLSITMALSETKTSAMGCALIALLMAVIGCSQASTLSQQPPSLHLIATLATLTLFFMATLFIGVSLTKSKNNTVPGS